MYTLCVFHRFCLYFMFCHVFHVLSRDRSFAMMDSTDQNVIALTHRCDEHQLCITMLSGTKSTDQMAQLFLLGKAVGIWTVWERLTRRTCELLEITQDCMFIFAVVLSFI